MVVAAADVAILWLSEVFVEGNSLSFAVAVAVATALEKVVVDLTLVVSVDPTAVWEGLAEVTDALEVVAAAEDLVVGEVVPEAGDPPRALLILARYPEFPTMVTISQAMIPPKLLNVLE